MIRARKRRRRRKRQKSRDKMDGMWILKSNRIKLHPLAAAAAKISPMIAGISKIILLVLLSCFLSPLSHNLMDRSDGSRSKNKAKQGERGRQRVGGGREEEDE